MLPPLCAGRSGLRLRRALPCDRLPTREIQELQGESTMKYWLTLIILLAAAILMGADAATFIGHDKVADALAKGGSLAATKEYTVSGAHRTAAGQVEVHH